MVEDGVKIDAPQTGMMRFRVPPNSVGKYVTLSAPNGQPFRVLVPTTASVGDMLQVKIPDNLLNTSNQQPQSNQRDGNNVPGTQLMSVICPANARPGQTIEIMVANIGKMRVQVPQSAIPGQAFYFRVRA